MIQITGYNISLDKDNNFINIENNENINLLIKKYSLAKYGSIKDIKIFANIIVKILFKEIDNYESEFRHILEKAKRDNDYIVLMTPGYRNVKASANLMFNIALPYINTKLTMMNFPIITKLKLPRLASPCENYASLTAEERKIVGLTTDHILPDDEFYKNKNIHVIYGDDIFITGSSSNKVKTDVLSKKAKSFISIFPIVVDKNITLKKPSIEEEINKFKVTGKLDDSAKEIFIQNDFIPILRSLRLLLNKENLSNLKEFINKLPINNILKVYIAYMTNENLTNEKYIKSIEIIKKYLIEKKVINSNGLLLKG